MGIKIKTEVSQSELNVQKEYMDKVRNLFSGRHPKAIVITQGCQQNENDSEKLRGMLSKMGYTFTDSKDDADLILFNTCSVRRGAELKVLGMVGALAHAKDSRPDLLVGMCGCMLQQEQAVKDVKRKYPQVDFTFGTHSIHKFPEVLFNALSGQRIFMLENINGVIAEDLPSRRDSKIKAGLSVMYGCNNFCSYCIVPYVRGRERSREPHAVIEEAKALIADGVRDLTLLGQNVNSYGLDLNNGWNFPKLLRAVNDINGDFRIRFMTSHPKDAGEELFDAIADCDKVVKHLHLPFQSGSDNVLRLMNRGYTRKQYIKSIESMRKRIPDIVLTSDVIVGFPGETEEDFSDTISLISEIEFDLLFTFIFSKRAGTPAAVMENQIDKDIKKRRFLELTELQNKISKVKNDAYLGKTITVLAEGESKNDPHMMSGRSDGGKLVHFQGDNSMAGRFVDMKIIDVKTWSMTGEVLKVR